MNMRGRRGGEQIGKVRRHLHHECGIIDGHGCGPVPGEALGGFSEGPLRLAKKFRMLAFEVAGAANMAATAVQTTSDVVRKR